MSLQREQGRVFRLLPSMGLAVAAFLTGPQIGLGQESANELQISRLSEDVLPTLPYAVDVGENRLTARRSPIVLAIEKAEAAVVNIQGNKTISTTTAGSGTVKQEVSGMGTGVIIDPRGYIITNLHVVQDVPKIEVTLPSGETSIAKLLNYDLDTDLALIKVDSDKSLPVVPFGTSHDLYRGETVIAIGNPFGYQNTVTVGVISALHRDVPVNGTQEYQDLIQTSADINPGNSGGPLINVNGEVIGINVAVRVGAQGIGFAIPIDNAVDVMAELASAHRDDALDHGLVLERDFSQHEARWKVKELRRGDIQLTSSRRTEVSGDLKQASDAIVKPGDFVVQVAGSTVPARLALELALLDLGRGDRIELKIERDGQLLTQHLDVQAKAGSEPPDSTLKQDAAALAWTQLGLRLEEVGADQVRTSTEAYQGGLRITEIRENSPAAQQKLAVGDSIVGVMNWQTPNWKAMSWVLNNNELHHMPSTKFYIVRNQRPFYVPLAVGQSAKVR